MTRNYYGDVYGEMDRYRRYRHQPVHYYDDRSVPLHMSYAEGQASRTGPASRPDHGRQEQHDQEQPLNGSTRRRIAVACARCRKRKIKCSGDPGNGLGCQNCRTAGVDSCNFFRVGSLELQTVGHQHPGAGGGVANYLSAANGDRLQYLNLQQYSYSQPHQPLNIATRGLHVNPYYSADGHQYEAETSPADSYVLSPQTAIGPQDSYAGSYPMHESGRNWSSPVPRYPLTSYHTRYGEQDPGSQYSYPPSMQQPRRAALSDGSGSFNTSSLQMSLPNPPTTERVVLPPPNACARQLPATPYDIAQMRTGISNSLNISIPSCTRTSPTWSSEQATLGTRNDPVPSTRSSDFVPPMDSKPSTASCASSENLSLTFIPSNGSPDVSPTTCSQAPSQLSSSHQQYSGGAQHEHSIYSLHCGSASETKVAPSGLSGGNLYSFSIARRPSSHQDLSSTDDRLINGTPYVPLQPSNSPTGRLDTINTFRHEASDHRPSALHHRNSMPIVAGQD